MRPIILDTVIRRSVFCKSRLCIRVSVYVTAVPLFVGDVSFGRGYADPGPEGAGVGIVAWEVNLDGQVGSRGAGVEDGTCV